MPVELPYTFRTAGARTPLNRLDANFAALAAWINSRVAAIGPLTSRPLPGHAGTLYVASDQGYAWYLDDGAVWHPVGGLGDGALTVHPDTENVRCFGAGLGTDGRRVVTGLIGTPPTTRPADMAHLGVADKGGENGRANWTTYPEAGGARPVDPVLFRRVGQVSGFAAVSGATETVVATVTLPPGTLIGRSLEVALRYDAPAPAARTLTFRVKLGPGPFTLATSALVCPSPTLLHGVFGCQIDALSSTLQRAGVTDTPCAPGAFSSITNTTADGTLDAALALPLILTAQWSTTGATLNAYAFTVRLI